jgi:hypothetical protein
MPDIFKAEIQEENLFKNLFQEELQEENMVIHKILEGLFFNTKISLKIWAG